VRFGDGSREPRRAIVIAADSAEFSDASENTTRAVAPHGARDVAVIGDAENRRRCRVAHALLHSRPNGARAYVPKGGM